MVQSSTRLILIGAAVLLSIGMGLRQSIGLFLTPVTRDLALTAADFTLTIAIQNIVWGVSQAPAGAIADRFGLRVTLVAGTVIYIAGLVLMAAAGSEMTLIVSSVLIGVALACTASSLALAACARAVPERSRSNTLGVVAAVGSLPTLILLLATQGVLKFYPWQIGAGLSALVAAAMLPAAFWAGASDKLPVMTAAAKTTMRDTLGFVGFWRRLGLRAGLWSPSSFAARLAGNAAIRSTTLLGLSSSTAITLCPFCLSAINFFEASS
jgi:MFS family permease